MNRAVVIVLALLLAACASPTPERLAFAGLRRSEFGGTGFDCDGYFDKSTGLDSPSPSLRRNRLPTKHQQTH